MEFSEAFVNMMAETINYLQAKCDKLQYQRDKALELMGKLGRCSVCAHELDHVVACACYVEDESGVYDCANFIPAFDKHTIGGDYNSGL